MNNSNHLLLQPYKLSSYFTLKNRIVMAPMTRRYADHNRCPTHPVAEYYARRADAGLIVTEGTIISEDAVGYGNVPGIFTEEQIDAWSKVTEQVHAANGLIFMQLWHSGRVSHPHFHQGRLPISASATSMSAVLGNSGFTCGQSRAASYDEIQEIVGDYAKAARNAIKAGFDGVEIHGANGYLVDQFLHYCSNHRDDDYGGRPENMARFCLDVVHACAEAIGIERIGLRLSPGGHMAEIVTDPKDKLVFFYLLQILSAMSLAYIHIGTFDDSVCYAALDNKTMTDFVRSHSSQAIIASGGYDPDSAHISMMNNQFDLIALGRLFIANSDLIVKISNHIPLIPYHPTMLADL